MKSIKTTIWDKINRKDTSWHLLRQLLGRVSYLVSHRSLIWIEPHFCIGRPGHNFFEDGWHPYTSLLSEIAHDNPTDQEIIATEYFDFEMNVHLTDYCWSPLHNKLDIGTPYWNMPWGKLTKLVNTNREKTVIIENARRLFILRQSIRKEGYNAIKYGPDYACGVLLNSNSRGRRFVIFSGNHRIAVCRNLGIKHVLFQLSPEKGIYYNGPFEINEADLQNLSNVISGKFTPELAQAWFDFYFTPHTKTDLSLR